MLFELIGVVFCCGKGETRCDDTLDSRQMVSTTGSQRSLGKGTYVGSLARFKNNVVLSILPFSSKSLVKNLLVSKLTPMAPKTMEKFSSCLSCTSLPGC